MYWKKLELRRKRHYHKMANSDGSSDVRKEMPRWKCKTCFGLMPKIKRYVNVDPFHYSDEFPVRFPWIIRIELFRSMLDDIDVLAIRTSKSHHFMADLRYLNAIFKYRYVEKNYSFSIARDEYVYMIDMLNYLCVFFDNDIALCRKIEKLQNDLSPEWKKATENHYYKPCECHEDVRVENGCAPGMQYSKEAREKNMHLRENAFT